jgi:hypothetical protein
LRILKKAALPKIDADLVNCFPNRFLFDTYEVASANQETYFEEYNQYNPLWRLLSKEAVKSCAKGTMNASLTRREPGFTQVTISG